MTSESLMDDAALQRERIRNKSELVRAGLKKRYAAERRFRLYGLIGTAIGLGFILLLFYTIGSNAIPAFTQTMLRLEIELPAEEIDPQGTQDPEVISNANFRKYTRNALRGHFPEVKSRRDKRKLAALLSPGAAFKLRETVLADPSLIGQRVTLMMPMSDDIDQLNKGVIDTAAADGTGRVSKKQIEWFQSLKERGLVETVFNTTLFTAGDSREPELAGILGALVGSFFTMLITLVLSFPVAVASAVYLEEFAPKNKWTQLIEININNLAAVPSIVFGLLGLAVFLNFFGLPRSAPLVGGMVLALMTLPTIIIAGRAALKSVPPSIRDAARGLGASPLQVTMHHVLPLAMPGILTGAIIGMARAVGETAPLLMIGMVAFIVDIPGGVTDPATVMPVQIYLWSDAPERAFMARTSAAIAILLVFLIAMNALAVVLRNKFERKW